MQVSRSSVSVRLAIVDPTPHDYGDLLAAAGSPGVSLHFLVTGRDALQFARRWKAGLWVVNSRLGDMSGFELAATLRSTRPSALIFIIGENYNLADELQTLTMGFAKYICKPLEPSWVMPNEGESCIPLPACRVRQPSPSAFSTFDHHPDTTRFPISTGLSAALGGRQVILPFADAGQQRPAA